MGRFARLGGEPRHDRAHIEPLLQGPFGSDGVGQEARAERVHGTNPMPRSSHVESTSCSGSPVQTEYSFCTAVTCRSA